MSRDPELTLWLTNQGLIDVHGVNATPRQRRCHGCGAPVWAAWRDGVDDVIAVDPIALTPLGELQALTDRRVTVTHWAGGLDVRRAEWIRRIPASPTNTIRPSHQCGARKEYDHYPEKRKARYEQAEEIPY